MTISIYIVFGEWTLEKLISISCFTEIDIGLSSEPCFVHLAWQQSHLFPCVHDVLKVTHIPPNMWLGEHHVDLVIVAYIARIYVKLDSEYCSLNAISGLL